MVRSILGLVAALVTAAAAQAASVQPPPPPVEDYGKLPGMAFVTLSPSGQRYAFVASVMDKRKLYVATTTNQLIESEDLGAAKVVGLRWAGDDHLLVTLGATVRLGVDFVSDKAELTSVVGVDLAHHKAIHVFAPPYDRIVAQTVVGTYGAREIGGHWFGFFGGYSYEQSLGGGILKTGENGRLIPDLYRVDLDTGRPELASRGQEDIREWLIGPAGEVAARLFYNDKNGDWRIFGSNFGGVLLASGNAPTEQVSIRGLGRTPDSFLLGLAGHDQDTIEELPLAGGQARATYADNDDQVLLFDRMTHLWIGTKKEEGHASSDLFAPAQQAKLRGAVKAFPGYLAHLVSFDANFDRMIMFTDGGDDSGTFWIVDIAKGSADILGGAYPTIGAASVGPVRLVDYKASDGLAMDGVLTLPPGREAKKLPLVVMPHGGPEAHDQPSFDYWAQAFASRGFAVWQPNFRGSAGSGNAFRDAGYGQWGRKMQTDISDGVAELARQGSIDPTRACIVGASYGGYAALAGVTVQHGLYRCAVSVGGVADLSHMLAYWRERTGAISASVRYWKEYMGVGSGSDPDLKDISPVRNADHADGPILLIHGRDDTVVPIDQSQSMERALKSAGKPVELITLPGADHWLLEEDARIAMLKASIDFVLKNNPPDAAPQTVAAAIK